MFRKFVNGIAFFQDQIPNDKVKVINEAMVNNFEQECHKKNDGQYHFDCSLYLIRAEK